MFGSAVRKHLKKRSPQSLTNRPAVRIRRTLPLNARGPSEPLNDAPGVPPPRPISYGYICMYTSTSHDVNIRAYLQRFRGWAWTEKRKAWRSSALYSCAITKSAVEPAIATFYDGFSTRRNSNEIRFERNPKSTSPGSRMRASSSAADFAGRFMECAAIQISSDSAWNTTVP